MRGVSLSFFKPSVFVKAFLVSCVVFSSAFFSSCKDLTSFDPNVDGGRAVTGSAFSAPVGLTATNGYKQKISLSWNPVSGAKNYEIWCAESPTAGDDGWKKVQVTDKIQHDDKVGAGRTLYYRVRAVKSTGATSPYSSIVKGTSLAVPVIGGGEVGNSSVTIQWFMENARGVDGKSNYEDELIFDISYQKKIGGDPITITKTATELGSEYKHTFENLAGTTSYQFWIEAHTIRDSAVEKSPVVDVNTLTSYTPLAPEFNATKGESAKGVRLYITLPEMVMVNTETHDSPSEKVDEPYPLYFEIWRKAADGADTSYEKVCPALYYNGSTTPPETSYYTSSPYKAGEEIEWFDESEDLVGGQKYTYKVLARVDIGYSKVVCPGGKEYTGSAVTPDAQAKTDEGWKSATPNFNVKEIADSKRYSYDKTSVTAVDFGFTVSWQDLGKAGEYKFAIKQHREPWDSSSGSGEDKDKWLENGTGKYFFDTLDEVKARIVKFGSEQNGLKPEEEGIYTYTLYIVREGAEISDGVLDGEKVLDSVDAIDKALVTHEVNLPNAVLEVEGGYKESVHIIISGLKEDDKDATYTLIRTWIVDGRPADSKEIPLEIPEEAFASGKHEFDDTEEVIGNRRYSYVLKAAAESGAYSQSDSQDAETLGTPSVTFEMGSLAYDSVTISFNGVLAADHYVVKLGVEGGFGNGEEFTITKDTSASDDSEGAESQDEKWISSSAASGATANVTFVANRFTIKIEKPYGYDDARFAGLPADLTVTAHSENDRDSAESAAKSVNVLGPASVKAEVGTSADATEKSIWVTWNSVDGANGYLIKRVMYDSVEMTKVTDFSEATYYYNVSDGTLSVEDGTIDKRAMVERDENGFKLTDNYDEPDDDTNEYQVAQSKISWGLPFRYVVLPVLNEKDFSFGEKSLALAGSGKVAYKNFEEKQTEPTATWGYGLEVHAEKAVSGTLQIVRWQEPFYGKALTSRVYRRKFADRDKGGNWEAITSIAIKDCTISYSPSGADRYCAWEYAVKYSKSTSNEIVQSYVDWMDDKEHDETDYDYGSMTKEKLNKGYLLAMDYEARYGGTGTSKNSETNDTVTDYYSEDVEITPWGYKDRALGPDSVELRVLSLDLAKGWQSVGTLDPSITGFTKKETLTDTIVSDVQNWIVKLKPEGISNGTIGTTDGPLKILRSAKHFYGLNLSRGEYSDFDCKNYEEYAYRQITDEELIKSTMLVLASLFSETTMSNKTYTTMGTSGENSTDSTYAGYDGSTVFRWGQGSNSKLYWQLSELLWGWLNLPCGEEIYKQTPNYYSTTGKVKHFISIADREALTSTKLRGYKYAKALNVLGTSDSFSDNNNYIALNIKFEDEMVNMTKIDSATVYFTADVKNGKFYSYVNDNSASPFSASDTNNQIKWIPVVGSGTYAVVVDTTKTTFYVTDSTYGWWDNNN